MTDKTQPEALRLALSIDLMDTFTNYQQEELNKAAAELRRLHVENERLSGLCDKWNSECDEFREDNKRLAALVEAQQHTRIAELEAELEAVGAGGVQAFSAAPEAPSVEQVEHEVRMGHIAWDMVDPQKLIGAVLRLAASPPAEQPIGELVVTKTRDGEIVSVTRQDDEGRILSVIATSDPAEQQAAPKAAQYEMDKEASNVRLDIDSNSTKPEQQRDVACSLEVGQHVGNGEHQEASCRGSKDSELLKIAARNLKYFIEHAQFSSFADKRAALNCLDVLAAPQQEPLTDEQWQLIADLTDSILTRATKDEIERVIGITQKGGQHGTER